MRAPGAERRMPSSTPRVPSTFTFQVPSGSPNDCPTDAAPARWKMASGATSAMTPAIPSASVMSTGVPVVPAGGVSSMNVSSVPCTVQPSPSSEVTR